MNEIDFNAKTNVACYNLKLFAPTREGRRV